MEDLKENSGSNIFLLMLKGLAISIDYDFSVIHDT